MRVAIVGAGVAGLTAALALQRDGHEVRVHEQATELRTGGFGLNLWSNAGSLLHGLGVEIPGEPYDHMQFRVRGRARAVVRLPNRRWPHMNVERTALVRAIHHELADDTVVFGSEIASAAELLSDGADLVVAADGVGSRLRPGAGEPARLRAPWSVWQAVVPGAGDLIEAMGSAIVLAPHHFLGIYRQPNRELCWFLEDPTLPDNATASDVLDMLSRDDDPLVRAVVEATSPGVFGRWLARDRWPSAAGLTGDRLVAIGDAAHPMLPCAGQGACTSMEDSVALAIALRTGSVAAAVTEYRKLRLRTAQWRVASSHLGCTSRRPSPFATAVAATPFGVPSAKVAGIGLRLNGRGDRRLVRAVGGE